LATSAGQLIAFRVIQGVGGGMIVPIGQMILVKKAGPRQLARVMAATGIPVVLAPVIGPTVGGLLLDSAGWRWIFYVNVPVGIIAFIAGLRLLPHDRPEPAGRLDALGLGLVAPGVVGLTYGLAEIGTTGSFSSARVIVPTLAGAALVAAFVVRSLRVKWPLLDLRLYANKGFSASSLATFGLGAALFGGMILMPLYFQTVRHESAVMTGLLLAPQGLGAVAAMWVSGRAVDRFGAGATAFVGGLIAIASTVPFVMVGANTPFGVLAVAMVARGFGFGTTAMPAMTAGFRVLEASQVNDAAPQLNVLMRVGGSIGTAILTVVLQHHLVRAGSSPSAQAAAFGTTFWWVLAVSAVSVAPTVLLWRLERRAPAFMGEAHTEPLMEPL
ncbi:MAG: DHA2 family efflux MFS transporter permease subunit, partial [Acidimicrobiaceae bacterium]|nr:DHA2 family efflux MFS transporter permease subunit [Acidimicrobiaceae bacterium]